MMRFLGGHSNFNDLRLNTEGQFVDADGNIVDYQGIDDRPGLYDPFEEIPGGGIEFPFVGYIEEIPGDGIDNDGDGLIDEADENEVVDEGNFNPTVINLFPVAEETDVVPDVVPDDD